MVRLCAAHALAAGLAGVALGADGDADACTEPNPRLVAWGSSASGGFTQHAGIKGLAATGSAFAATFPAADGSATLSVRTWGSPTDGGDASTVSALLASGVRSVHRASDSAFAAILEADGALVTWGGEAGGAGSSSTVAAAVVAGGGAREVIAARSAGIAHLADESVVCWGDADAGGDCATVASALRGASGVLGGRNRGAVAAVAASGRELVAWGEADAGGSLPAALRGDLGKDVASLAATSSAFAARFADGSVAAWGRRDVGGDLAEAMADAIDAQDGAEELVSTNGAFAARTAAGGVIAWGSALFGGDVASVVDRLVGVEQVVATDLAFAARTASGEVVCWGAGMSGGDCPAELFPGAVRTLAASSAGFAAITEPAGQLVAWGGLALTPADEADGKAGVTELTPAGPLMAAWKASGQIFVLGGGLASASGMVRSPAPQRLGLAQLTVADVVGAVAGISEDASEALVTFGAVEAGGAVAPMGAASANAAPPRRDDVVDVAASAGAVAVLRADHSVVAWGSPLAGGAVPAKQQQLLDEAGEGTKLLHLGVRAAALAALVDGDRLVLWGAPFTSRGVPEPAGFVAGVASAVATLGASGDTGAVAAVLADDGAVVAVGNPEYGGRAPDGLRGVEQLAASFRAFAALRADGTLAAWGEAASGGALPEANATARQQDGQPPDVDGANFVSVHGAFQAFAAVDDAGGVLAWGAAGRGGDASSVQELLQDVEDVTASAYAFAARTGGGGVVAWGESSHGGRAPDSLTDGVERVAATEAAFAAVKDDGSVVAWGAKAFGGDATTVKDLLAAGVSSVVGAWEGYFAALKEDGSVVQWGGPVPGRGGPGGPGGAEAQQQSTQRVPADISTVQALLQDVVSLRATDAAFLAVTAAGDHVVWGEGAFGGDALRAPGAACRLEASRIVAGASVFVAVPAEPDPVAPGNGTDGPGDGEEDDGPAANTTGIVVGVAAGVAVLALAGMLATRNRRKTGYDDEDDHDDGDESDSDVGPHKA